MINCCYEASSIFGLYRLVTSYLRKVIVLNDDILETFEVCVRRSEKLTSIKSLILFTQTLIKKFSSKYGA